MAGSFLDSNVLLYSASGEMKKAERADQLIAAGGTISVQVLNEVANVARRKMRMSWSETRDFLSLLRGLLHVEPITVAIHETGIELAERYRLPVYDAMIAAAALHAGCDTLWSEDFQSGSIFNKSLRVVNPFVAPA